MAVGTVLFFLQIQGLGCFFYSKVLHVIGLLADYINPNTALVIALTHNQIPSEYSGDSFVLEYCVLESDQKTNLLIYICHNYFEFL